MPRAFEMTFKLLDLRRAGEAGAAPSWTVKVDAAVSLEDSPDWEGTVEVQVPSPDVEGPDEMADDFLRVWVFPRMVAQYAQMACWAARDLGLDQLGGDSAPGFMPLRYRNRIIGNCGMAHQDAEGNFITFERL